MDPLVSYYLQQAGRGSYRGGGYSGIGPVYSTAPFVQRGHGIGSFLSGLFRFVKPILWSGAKVVGRETLRTGGKILQDIADNSSPDVKARDIVSKHIGESTRNLIGKLRGKGRKRKRHTSSSPSKTKKRGKTAKFSIKRDIFD